MLIHAQPEQGRMRQEQLLRVVLLLKHFQVSSFITEAGGSAPTSPAFLWQVAAPLARPLDATNYIHEPHFQSDFQETVLHNGTWSVERHATCPPAYMQLLSQDTAHFGSPAASAPPLSQSLEAPRQQQLEHLPLPPGWELLADATGRPYYGNPTLRITQYQHPGVERADSFGQWNLHAQQPPVYQPFQRDAARMSLGSSAIELQEIDAISQVSPRSLWQHRTDAYGRHYVLNTMTGETKWEYGN